MKVFTKLGLVFLMAILASGMLWAQNSAMEIAPNANNTPYASKAMFDLQFDFAVGVGGGEAGIETDGNYIYTSMWNGAGGFQRYAIDGSWIGTITVTGSTGCRDIAYDGTYFYGGAAATTIFEMDLANATMISTFTGPAACRAIAYNEDDDAFYCNNWSDNITKFNKAGANLGSFPCGASAPSYYGFAYQGAGYCSDGPFLWGYSQTGATSNQLIQMALPSGAETGVTFDVGSVAGVGTGIAGGLAISSDLVSGYWTILGTSQNVDIWGLELCMSGPPPTIDVGISAILSPVSGSGLTASETVTVTVKNFGTDPASNIPVSFTLDGGAAVNETVTSTINGGATLDYTFIATADLSALGSHDITSCTSLTGDLNTANDCKSATVSNLTQAMVYPQSADYWTGTCTTTAKTDVSYIRSYGGGEQGWMKFDISSIPAGSTINWVKFHGYVTLTNYPYWSITPMALDPVTATAADIYAAATAGSVTGVAYSYNNETSTFAPGWHDYLLGATVNADLGSALAQGWFSVGIYERDGIDTYYLELDGWNETNVPYLEIDYSVNSTGNLDGTVTDAGTSAPISGATVTVAGLMATTAGDGTYMIANVPTGSQNVVCSATGYLSDNATVSIVEGNTTTQDFALSEASGLAAPTNLTASVSDNDVTLNWTSPGGGSGSGQWVQWDAGTNTGNGIGLTSGGTFYCAAHWTPAQLAAYDGQEISMISFFPNADPAATFALKAWTGASAGTLLMTQAISSYTVDMFNEIDLTSSIIIDASTDLWIGYSCTHGAGTFPAGCDDGPAVAYGGDMISLDGTSWVSMSTDYGLDYNWNIAAYVLDAKSSNKVALPIAKLDQTSFVPASFSSAADAGLAGNAVNKFVPNANKALLGFNVYRDGGMIDYTTATTYIDMDLAPATYDYYVTAVYDEGESDPSNSVTATITGGTANVIFEDDFEAYTAGQQLACQNPTDWTTWSNLPCDATEDAYVSDAFAYSGNNSAVIAQNNDLVKNLDTYLTSGAYTASLMLYIPTGFDGYYNAMSDFDGAYEWGFEVYFNVGGDGTVNGGGTGAATFNYSHDTWMNCELMVDLDNDWAEFYIDGVLIHGWQWTLGAAAGGAQLQLAAFDFFGATATTQMYFDDFLLTDVAPPPPVIFADDFEAYTAGQQLACQNPTDWTTWSNLPCDATEDAYVSDAFAYSGNNSAVIAQNNDLVKNLDTYLTSGAYTASQMVYIPTGFDGYYNAMSDFDGGYEWGFEVYFNVGGDGSVNGGATGAATFTYNHDVWMLCELNIDLDADLAEFYIDGTLIHSWQWTLGAAGGGAQLQLAAFDFFGATATTQMYFDDFVLDGTIGPVLNPPTNLTGPTQVEFGDDIVLTWNPPSSGSGDEFFEDFESGTLPTGWLAIDNDNDGFNWVNIAETGFGFDAYQGTGAMTSSSYDNTAGPLTPDNYLITPPIVIGPSSELSYFHDAQDPLYADDFYYVKLSTTGTALSDFTETLWSGTTPADWAEVTIDLSAYAGYTCYIAFHHTDCTDWFWMKLDNVTVTSTKSKSQYTPPIVATMNQGMPFRTSGMSESDINETYANYEGPKSAKALLGYNVYRKHNLGSFDFLAFTVATTYTDVANDEGIYTYYVTALYDEGESGPSNEHVVDLADGISENLLDSATKLYPNPATNLVNINSDYIIQSVTVYNYAGQAVVSEVVNNKIYQVNTSEYQAGIYFFQIDTKEGRISKRVIIK